MGRILRRIETGRRLIYLGFGLIGVGIGFLLGTLIKKATSEKPTKTSEERVRFLRRVR